MDEGIGEAVVVAVGMSGDVFDEVLVYGIRCKCSPLSV